MSERNRYSKRYNYLWDFPKVSKNYINEDLITSIWREGIDEPKEIARILKIPPMVVYEKMRELCLID